MINDNNEEIDYEIRQLLAVEGLLRRAALVDMPFILKGSLLTRQYLSNRDIRNVEDIDFLYAGKIEQAEQASRIFTDWMIQVTELDLNDGVTFRSFRENAFWRSIDYAMVDDFPTVNTDIAYSLTEEREEGDWYNEIQLDISFNLEMAVEPVGLEYDPIQGDSFYLSLTVPLGVQVAWKLHQTIVRARFKDLYDLQYLLSHPSYDQQALELTMHTLMEECCLNPSITKKDMHKVLVGDLHYLYPEVSKNYDIWRYKGEQEPEIYFAETVVRLREIMNQVGINEQTFAQLPDLSGE
ncbi:nucleotidyl transferase AbiEii/AbiGii toxin family protein [Paenibacillus shenyangensis]|uniref:nucleotidyl transferase AbiEii/AbiGii toxin family protein n=1 Tax=Paenibacillus sp. A9 TaxID=1284352 RepID=UPI000370463C|nr:nucleotidyl transferase AbiEii/AbiGii toxin family protein [Paenibacillus sp. A9]